MEKMCKSFSEFNLKKLEEKIGPLEKFNEKKTMAFFREETELFFQVTRIAYHYVNTWINNPDAVLNAFIGAFEYYGEDEPDGLFERNTAELLQKILLLFVELGFVRTDFRNDVLNALCDWDLGVVEDVLFENGQYETWEQDKSKSVEDVENYICKLLPPGQGEIYIYHIRDPYDFELTEYQHELYQKAYINIHQLCFAEHEKDGGPIMRFITKKS